MKRFFSDAAITAFAQFCGAGAALLIQIISTRYLLVAEYGAFSTIQAVILITEAVFLARGGEIALDYIGKFWEKDSLKVAYFKKKLFYFEIKYNLYVYIGVTVFSAVLFRFVDFSFEWLLLLAISIPLQSGYGVAKSILTVAGDFRVLSLLEIMNSAFLVLTGIVFISRFGVYGLISTVLCAALLKNVSYLFAVRYLYGDRFSKDAGSLSHFDRVEFRFFSANVYSVVRNFLMNFSSQGDLIILSLFQGPEAVANYKIAKTISSIPVKLVAPVWVVMRSRIMMLIRTNDISNLRMKILKTAFLLILFGAILSVPVTLMGEVIISKAFGEEYINSISACAWLLAGSWIFGALSGWLSFACVISPKKNIGIYIYGAWAIVVLVGGFSWGGESYSAMAATSCFGMLLSSVIGWLFFMRRSAWVH